MSSRIREQRSPEAGTATIANTEFDTYEVGGDKIVSAQVFATGLDAADGAIFIEQSNNGEDWDDSGLSVTLPSGNSTNTFELSDVSTRYLRARMAQGSNTVGELYVLYVSK